jgi:uncharacterized protein YbaR (Trm112 family)/SAM-dependent methyltransferase
VIEMNISGLVCPVTKQTLSEIAGRLVSQDRLTSYPVSNGVPVLLGPEATSSSPEWPRDTTLPQYAEAYSEMEFYNMVGAKRAEQIRASGSVSSVDSISMKHLFETAKLPPEQRCDFPNPPPLWICDNIDAACEGDCYRHIGPVKGKRVVQIGGSGTTALLLLLAGAAEAILLTPMAGEAQVALENARLLGLSLSCVVGIGEELPFEDGYADVCFVGGCVHHMRTEIAFAEISRVLTDGGKFAAIEPWRAPGYTIGTKLFGKREANPFCSPLTKERMLSFYCAFTAAECVQHGSLTRYPSIVAQKAGLRLSVPHAEWVTRLDDTICNCIPFARRLGSGVALLATK